MQLQGVSPYLGEIIGTAILIIFGGGTVACVVLARSKGQNGGWIVVTTGWGLGVGTAAYCVGRISGAHLNPALTIALAAIGTFSWSLVPGYILSQFIGAILGSGIVWLCYLPHWKETADPAAKLGARKCSMVLLPPSAAGTPTKPATTAPTARATRTHDIARGASWGPCHSPWPWPPWGSGWPVTPWSACGPWPCAAGGPCGTPCTAAPDNAGSDAA